MTLAHRGMNWALLQNIASHLWNNIMDLTFKIKVRSVTYIRPVRWDPSLTQDHVLESGPPTFRTDIFGGMNL